MCAIFGSKDFSFFKSLAELNSYRGQHSYSITQFDRSLNIINQIKSIGNFDYQFKADFNTEYFLGHIQAPTTQVSGIHPCIKNSKMLWHNGIIKQFELDKFNWTGWDTEFLLDHLNQLSDINGSFACALYEENILTFFRNEISPLFFDLNLNISSTKFENSTSLIPNRIFKMNLAKSELKDINKVFVTKENPYYFID